MKAIFIVALLVTTLSVQPLQSQTKAQEERNNTLSLNIPRLFVNTFNISYERMTENNTSAFISGSLTFKDDNYVEKHGWSVELQYRFYSSINRDKIFQGSFVAPYIGNRYIDIRRYQSGPWPPQNGTKRHEYYNTITGGIVGGFRVAIMQSLVLSFELGGGIRYTTGTETKSTQNIMDYGYSGISPKFEFSIGTFF